MGNRIYIVDNRYYDAVSAAFGHGRIFLPSVSCKALAEPVSAHPDMMLFSPEKGQVICAREVFSEYHRLLSPFGVRPVCGESHLGCNYPQDVAYNVLYTPKGAFARFDVTDKKITDYLKRRNCRMWPVNQGYARCASVSFGNCLITADSTLSAAGKNAGLSVLNITPGFINLPGYDYGFLGGASGILDDNTVAFAGDLTAHPEGDSIKNFITGHGYFVADIAGMPLTDIGTIFCIEL